VRSRQGNVRSLSDAGYMLAAAVDVGDALLGSEENPWGRIRQILVAKRVEAVDGKVVTEIVKRRPSA
jgi:hypothetical protein